MKGSTESNPAKPPTAKSWLAVRARAPYGGVWQSPASVRLGETSQSCISASAQARAAPVTHRTSIRGSRSRRARTSRKSTHKGACMKKTKVGAARAPVKKAPGTKKSSTKARPSGAPGQGQLIEILERLARSTERLARAAERIAQAAPRPSGARDNEQPPLPPDEMPATPERL